MTNFLTENATWQLTNTSLVWFVCVFFFFFLLGVPKCINSSQFDRMLVLFRRLFFGTP